MSKIYIVESEFKYLNFYEGGGDCADTNIDKIFDSEEKAAAYIQDEIRKRLEEAADHPYPEEFIDSVPSIADILEKKSITYYSGSYEESTYSYTDYEVE
jgi:hypothetical protein